VVNAFFRLIGLEDLARAWLVDPQLVLGSTILVESWRMIGWNMVILLAGCSHPLDYYERLRSMGFLLGTAPQYHLRCSCRR